MNESCTLLKGKLDNFQPPVKDALYNFYERLAYLEQALSFVQPFPQIEVCDSDLKKILVEGLALIQQQQNQSQGVLQSIFRMPFSSFTQPNPESIIANLQTVNEKLSKQLQILLEKISQHHDQVLVNTLLKNFIETSKK